MFRPVNLRIHGRRMRSLACCLLIVAAPAFAQDIGNGSVSGDLNTNIGDNSVVDSNNTTNTTSTTYNGGQGPLSNPVPSAIAPTVMGGGGNDSCLIPNSRGIQISLFGIAQGNAEQDPECNRRKDARILGAPQASGGLGLQVSGISVMCSSPQVFKAMALASTPCPIFDVNRNALLMGRDSFEMMRSDPSTFVVGYAEDKAFWDAFLHIGEDLDEIEVQARGPISERLRSSLRGANNVRSGDSSQPD